MSERSDYIRCVSAPLEKKLRASIVTLAQDNARLTAALERIADLRNIHFAGDAQVVAQAALKATTPGKPSSASEGVG